MRGFGIKQKGLKIKSVKNILNVVEDIKNNAHGSGQGM